MNDRLRKVIALMDSSTESEAAAAFRKARELLRQDGAKFRDLLASAGPAPGTAARDARQPRDAEVLALRSRVAELEWHLQEANLQAESARRGLDAVERHLDGLDRKYKTALDRKDQAIAKLRRQLGQAAPGHRHGYEDGAGVGADRSPR